LRKLALPLLLAGALAGCATYQARSLGTRSTLPDRIPDLTIDARQMPLPDLAAHRFDPSDGLDMTEVAMLAVVNNPDLKIARDRRRLSVDCYAKGSTGNFHLQLFRLRRRRMEGIGV